MTLWPAQFHTAVTSFAPRLAQILHATGCREGWIQGELFRHFTTGEEPIDGDFATNTYPLGRGRADFYGKAPTEMIAELKVFGTAGYYHKNIQGYSNIDQFVPGVPGDRVDVTPQDLLQVNPRENSLLKDVLRLSKAPSSLERYMILIIHEGGPPDHFGRVIRALRVSRDEHSWELEGFALRVWRIDQ